ncbi:hypothetical protein PFLG_02251, partial [Plasmodium falciparum RAJ116]
MNSNHNMLKNNFTNAHTGYLNNDMPERCQAWVDLPETRNMINSSVGKTFINIPYENYEFGLRRMYTIDTSDLTNKQHLCALPKTEDSFTMCENKKNPAQHGNNGNNFHANLHENKSFNEQENHRFPQNNTKDVDIRNPTYNIQPVNNMPSFGTQFHHKGHKKIKKQKKFCTVHNILYDFSYMCSPCKYEWTRGCHLGSRCRFCHDQSHVPEGTQRVVPNPQKLPITRVKAENNFTSPMSRNPDAPFVTKPGNILNGKKKNRRYKKNANKRQRKGGENKMKSQKEEEKKMDSKKEEEKKMDSKKKEEKKMDSKKKEDKMGNQKKECKINNQKKERKTNNQTKERKTNNQTNENKTNNQTNENKTNNQTKEHNIYNCPRGNQMNYQNNKNSKKMNNVVNERTPPNIVNTQRNRNQIKQINYNDYTTLNTCNCTYNHNPYKDNFLNGHLNSIISNIVAHNKENDLCRIFCIIFKRDNAFEDYKCSNLVCPDT